MSRLLFRGLPLALGVLLFAGSASAIPILYTLTAGSQMAQDNTAAGGPCAPCTVPVTGTFLLQDDEAGNVSLAWMDLAHVGYEVATPGIVSVVIERTEIALSGGAAAGTGSTLGNVLFPVHDIAQTGTVTCTPGVFSCLAAGLPAGTTPLASPLVGIDLGTWLFDGLHNLVSASIEYTNEAGAIETLTLVGTATIVPEPGTGLLIAGGLLGLAFRRRAKV